MGGRDLVETREQVVQQTDDPVRIGSRRPWREAGDIGEQHRRFGVAVGDAVLAVLESRGDRGRNGVQQ